VGVTREDRLPPKRSAELGEVVPLGVAGSVGPEGLGVKEERGDIVVSAPPGPPLLMLGEKDLFRETIEDCVGSEGVRVLPPPPTPAQKPSREAVGARRVGEG